MIHEWKNTLCVHSKYKEDLVHIRDMHRLLSYKGASHFSILAGLTEQGTGSNHSTRRALWPVPTPTRSVERSFKPISELMSRT